MSQFYDESDGAEIELQAGRSRLSFTITPDWVLLSDLTPQAKTLYSLYALHLNQSRGDAKVWPTRRTLAKMMGFEKVGSVDRYAKELATFGAIDVIPRYAQDGRRTSNRIVVHDLPEADYRGPCGLSDFYRPTPPPPPHVEEGDLPLQGVLPLQGEGVLPLQGEENYTKESTKRNDLPSEGHTRPPAKDRNQASEGGTAARGTRLPKPFPVTESMRSWAADKAPHCGLSDHDAFCDYWWSTPGARGRKVDWEATWRNWMRKAQADASRYRPSSNGHAGNGRKPSTTDERVQTALDLGREMARELQEHGRLLTPKEIGR